MGLCVAYASQPANARDGAWYVGGDFGAMIVEDPDFTATSPAGGISTFGLNHHYGFDGALFVGYDFGAFRIEAEVAYKRARLEDFQTVLRLPVPAGGGQTAGTSFMVNGMIDFPAVQGFTFSGGMGMGAALVEFRDYRHVGATAPFIDTSDFSFAIQAIAGVRTAITSNIDIGLKYRFFAVPDLKFDSVAGERVTTSFTSQSAMLSLIYNFGTPPPPPPP
jgi:OmpA-OmpF porin, OOP family